MKTQKISKIVVALLIALAVVPLLFAQGAKEVSSDAIIGKIVAMDQQSNGTWRLEVRDSNGMDYIFRPAADCKLVLPIESMGVGDYVAVTTNGIMTASLPPQATAIAIQWINPLVASGVIEVSIPRTTLQAPTALEDQFSYSYAYFLFDTVRSQGIYPYAGYFARGGYDAAAMTEPLMDIDAMYTALDDYQYQILMMGAAVDEVGPVYNSVDALMALTAPEGIIESFSYGYGYLLAATALSQGFELTPVYFAAGVLDAGYQEGQIYTEAEMDAILDAYSEHLWSQMESMLAEMAQANLEEAEAFLAQNKTAEGVQTTASGLQYKINKIGFGSIPKATDVVRLDYELTLLDGQVMDSSYQRGYPSEFSPSQVISGFAEAITLFPAGTSMRVWLHPSLGYGENGNQNIEPNSLLIFDIETYGIVE